MRGEAARPGTFRPAPPPDAAGAPSLAPLDPAPALSSPLSLRPPSVLPASPTPGRTRWRRSSQPPAPPDASAPAPAAPLDPTPPPPPRPPAPPPPTGPGARAAWSEPSPTPALSPTSPPSSGVRPPSVLPDLRAPRGPPALAASPFGPPSPPPPPFPEHELNVWRLMRGGLKLSMHSLENVAWHPLKLSLLTGPRAGRRSARLSLPSKRAAAVASAASKRAETAPAVPGVAEAAAGSAAGWQGERGTPPKRSADPGAPEGERPPSPKHCEA
eukprot:tig00000449_g943.t1